MRRVGGAIEIDQHQESRCPSLPKWLLVLYGVFANGQRMTRAAAAVVWHCADRGHGQGQHSSVIVVAVTLLLTSPRTILPIFQRMIRTLDSSELACD